MSTITINDQEFQRRMRQMVEALGPTHLSRVLHDIGQNLVEGTRTRIDRGVDWQDRPFAPNTPVTLKRKRGTQPLIDSGVFKNSRLFHHVAGSSLTVGASGIQAGVLQFGARKGQFGTGKTRRFLIPWGNIPARPYLPISDDGQSLVPAAHGQIVRSIEEYIEAAAQ